MNVETNELFLAFSKLIKTIRLAKNSMTNLDDNQSLVNYHEVLKSFIDLGNISKVGACINNMSSIYMKKGYFKEALSFIDKAIEIQDIEIKNLAEASKSHKYRNSTKINEEIR
jgi:tetratricopeptide (TPR) repeat protein